MPQIPTQSAQDSDLPVAEFSVRTGAPQQGIKPKSSKPLEISDVKTTKGKWLTDKLRGLYEDPKFKNATPEQKKAWKELAYDKWVQPYYTKVLKTDLPSKEDWVAGKVPSKGLQQYYEGEARFGEEVIGHSLKATAEITAGILHNVAEGVNFINKTFGSTPEGEIRAQKIQQLGNRYSMYARQADQYLEEVHNVQPGEKPKLKDDVAGKLTELGTDAVFFEATGAAKGAKLLKIANPKTAALAYQMAKSSFNTAVEFGMWSASQGEKPEEIGESAALGGALGPLGKIAQRKAFDPLFELFKTVFKFGGPEATKEIINKAAAPKAETGGIALALQSRKASAFTQEQLNNYAIEKFKRPYEDLPYIQRQHVLTRLMVTVSDAISAAKAEGVPKEITQAQAKEQDDIMASIFPEAKQVQAKIDQFVKQNQQEPVTTKLMASLPHHNTTVDSSWKSLQARASYLKMRLSQAKTVGEKKDIQEALNEEYKLMKEKSAKQKAGSTKGTVGSAAAGDPRVFRGDEYVVTPNVDPYKHGFTDWYEDSFAKGVARSAKEQALVKGQKQSFLANSIDNSFLMGSNLAKAARTQDNITKQLFHSQYGLVGGINYNLTKTELVINYLAMRPNVVARVWNVPGGGQTLFLNAAMEAEKNNLGLRLIPFDESKGFYEKMGMKPDPENGSYMIMSKDGVKEMLRNKGLLMLLLGGGITYGMSNSALAQGDFSVKGSN